MKRKLDVQYPPLEFIHPHLFAQQDKMCFANTPRGACGTCDICLVNYWILFRLIQELKLFFHV